MSVPLPAAVYAQDTPVAALHTPEQFVLCSVRLWVRRYLEGAAGLPRLADGFAAANAASAAASFETFFGILAIAAQRSLDIRCTTCPRLGGDEARLLQAVSLLQHRRREAVTAILADWMPAAAIAPALEELSAFARALAQAGLTIVPRHGGAARPVRPATACPDRGLALLQ